MAEKYNEVANRLISTRSAAGNPSIDHIVTGADAVYDDTAPYRNSGHIECNEVTPTGTENPQELEWYEKVYDTLDPTLFEWIPTTDTTVDSTKTYGIPTGAKQSAINKQMYSMLSDISGVTINADDANKVITSDSSKIINKDDGYVPTAAAVGNAIGANFEDNLYSTSIVKGLTANQGRVLNNIKAGTNGYYEGVGVGTATNLDGDLPVNAQYITRFSGEVADGAASITQFKGNTIVWNQLLSADKYVDLGLPSGTIWTTCNIDTSQPDGFTASPFQYGCTMFSWGNIIGHNTPASGTTFDYNWGSVNTQEPWYEGQPYGDTLGSTLNTDIVVGDTQDAARYNLGSLFKMPTSTQLKELVDNCDFVQADGTTVIDDSVNDKRVTVNGVVGIYLKSKINGNLIFFSASGFGNRSSWGGSGAVGYYWSASFFSSSDARDLGYGSRGVSPQDRSNRFSGFAVRAVFEPTNVITIGHNDHKYYIKDAKNIFDLTLMFGSDNEPTIEEFNKLYPLYYGYNGGELRNVTASAIETTGFNQWDEEWEVGGLNTDGSVAPNNNQFRSKNYIPAFPSTTYYIKSNTSSGIQIFEYDVEKGYITRNFVKNTTITTNANTRYLKFRTPDGYIIYNNDICINLSDPAKNGTYKPYEQNQILYFNGEEGSITTLTGKPEGSVLSEVIFPEGMRSIGTIYDELTGLKNGYFTKAVKRIDSVDLGDLSWTYTSTYQIFYANTPLTASSNNNLLCSQYSTVSQAVMSMTNKSIRGKDQSFSSYNRIYIKDTTYTDAATFKAAMSGVILYYELATPITYTLDTPVPATYAVYNSGIEKRLPEDTASAVNAPIRYSVRYAMEAADTIRNLPINYISKESMDAFLTVLNTVTNGTWSMVYNSELGRYGFTFVPNESTSESTDNTNNIVEPTETI